MQATCPGSGLMEPGEQGVQEIGAPRAYVPLAHGMQSLKSSLPLPIVNDPFGHAMQSAADNLPNLELYVSAPQGMQLVWALFGLNVPAAHIVQFAWPAADLVPAEQSTQEPFNVLPLLGL